MPGSEPSRGAASGACEEDSNDVSHRRFSRRIAGVAGPTAIALALLCGSGTGLAQTPRGDVGNARLAQQVQQLAAERTMLQAENAQLKQQVEQLTKKADSADGQLRGLQQKLRASQQQAELAGTAQQQVTADAAALSKLRAQLQDLIAHYRDTIQTMRGIETDRNGLRAKLAASDSSLNTCVDRNANLYLTATQILDKYGHRGFWGCVADKEPFTQISRARLDNLIDGYRQQVAKLRLQQTKAGATGAGGGGP